MTEPTPTEETNPFTPITNQADLDTIISNQLTQELAKYSDYDTLKTKAAKLDELEEANKSELEKLQAKLTKAEAKVADFEQAAQVTAWKQQVAQETGLPAHILAGASLEEIQAHAKALTPLLTQAEPQLPKTVIRSEGTGDLPLNGDAIENSLKAALGIR